MTRTYETEQFLPGLIEAFQKEGHFIIREGDKTFVRIITEEGDETRSSGFCLSDIAAHLAERLSK